MKKDEEEIVVFLSVLSLRLQQSCYAGDLKCGMNTWERRCFIHREVNAGTKGENLETEK